MITTLANAVKNNVGETIKHMCTTGPYKFTKNKNRRNDHETTMKACLLL